MAATAVTLNDLKGHSPVAGLFAAILDFQKFKFLTASTSNICAAFYTNSTDSVLALCYLNFLYESRSKRIVYARNTESG